MQHRTTIEYISRALMSPSTAHLRQVNAALKIFEEKIGFDLDSVSLLEYKEFFTNYLLYKKNGGLAPSTTRKYFSIISKFVKWTYEAGKHSNASLLSYSLSDTSIKNIYENKVALTVEEMELIESCDVDGELESIVLDCAIFSMYTGMRWSDLSDLKMTNVFRTPYGLEIRYRAKKDRMKKLIRVPVFPKVANILAKHGSEDREFVFPWKNGTPIQNGIANQTLRAIVKNNELKITKEHKKISPDKRSFTVEVSPLHEIISMHCFRGTFCVWRDKMGDTPYEIIRLTGHSDISMLKHYINIDADRYIERLQAEIRETA